MKRCTVCQCEKPLGMFSPNAGCVGGYSTQCKECQAGRKRRERLADPEKVRAQERARIERNREAKRAACRKWYAANKEKRIATEKARYRRQSETIKEAAKVYRENNRVRVYAWNGTRRAIERSACPQWVDRGEVGLFYELAAQMTQDSGVRYHVDHIIPLRGKTVCGLHVPANLQVIPAKENLEKGARWT